MRYPTIVLIITLFIGGCNKDPRIKTYNLRPYNNSTLSGKVLFIETTHQDTTIVRLEAAGILPNTQYLAHLHTGTPGNLTGTILYFNHVISSNNQVTCDEKWNISFDNAIQSNSCFTVHNPTFFSNDTIGYVLAGNTGANAR